MCVGAWVVVVMLMFGMDVVDVGVGFRIVFVVGVVELMCGCANVV